MSRERFEQALVDLWSASLDVTDLTDSEQYVTYQVGKLLGEERRRLVLEDRLRDS